MKIGVSSYSFRKYILDTKCDYFKVCDIAKEIGFDGIKLIGVGARMYGMDTMLSDYLDVKVEFIDDPLRSPLAGAYKVLKNPKLLQNEQYQFKSIQNLIVDSDNI